MQTRFRRFLTLLSIAAISSASAFSAPAGSEPTLPKLHREYSAEIEEAAGLVADPARVSGLERFRLAFAMPYTTIRSQIGRVLFVLDRQTEIAEKLVSKHFADPIPVSPPSNQISIDLGLKIAKTRMAANCEGCAGTLDDFFKIFDIRDAHDGFSGLPFYGLVQARFGERRFQSEVLALSDSVEKTLEAIEENPEAPLKRDLWELALAATGRDEGRAIELLGILTSRDVLITRYLKYLRADDANFIRAFATIPLRIRLIGDLSKELSGTGRDLFSYPKVFESSLQKNYYFWSSALVSHRLRLLGHPEDQIRKLALEFPRQYKTLRFLAAGGPFKSAAYRQERTFDAKRVMHSSGAGAGFALDRSPTENAASDELEAFLNASTDPRDAAFLMKSELLRRAESAEGRGRLYLYFYDFGDSRIGLSHLKLGIDGVVYEIHRFPNSQQSYLRRRPQMQALRDARGGALPSGILEVPATPEQIAAIVNFLEVEGDAEMKYSFFHRLIQPDAYNCGGILYESLRSAGFPLPRLAARKFLPATLFHAMVKNLPATAAAGKGKSWLENLIAKPNLNSATLSPGGLEPNSAFSKRVGYEFLQAEQKLSERTPLFSNPRKAIGYLLKDYSNTGNLDKAFTPNSAKLLEVPTVLIPTNRVGATFSAAALAPANAARIRVDVAGKAYYRFFIHPNELENFADLRNRGPPDPVKWWGTPSSSARTFYVAAESGDTRPFAVKMSLSVVMGGSTRINTPDKLARAVALNDIVSEIHRETGGKIPGSEKTWSFLPEESAILPADASLGGMIVRDLPEDFASSIHLPWYALIADRKGQERWIDELFRYSGRKDKLEFVWKDLVRPLIEFHSLLALDNGLTTELHQQNLVLEIDPKTRKIRGFVLRDMDGNWIDYSVRRRLFPELPELTDAAAGEAKLMKYAEAQANQIFSYRNIIRDRTVASTFKYFLSPEDKTELLQLADQTMIRKFNHRFGDLARAHDLDSLETAWETVHSKTTSAAERKIYDTLLGRDGPVEKKSAYVRFTQKLEAAYFRFRKAMTRHPSRRALSARCSELLDSY